MDKDLIPESRYIKHLPSIYQEETKDGQIPFLDRYLLIFERILIGTEDKKSEFKIPYIFNAVDFKDLHGLLVKFRNCETPNIYLFCWDKIPGTINDSDNGKLIEYIKQNFDLSQIQADDISKDGTAINLSNGMKLVLNDERSSATRATLFTNGVRTDEFVARMENDSLNIYSIIDPLSWYIREKFSDELKNSINYYDFSTTSAELLRIPLVVEFNTLLKDESLYDKNVFGKVIPAESKRPAPPSQEEELVQFNRILLEYAYPDEIGKAQIQIKKGIAQTLDIIGDLFYPRFSFLHPEVSPLLKEEDIKNTKNLISKLKDIDDPLSIYLKSRFSESQRTYGDQNKTLVNLLDNYDGCKISRTLLEALIAEFNQLIDSNNSLYNKDAFVNVTLSEETQRLINQKPSGKGLYRLNRIVLEEAYPDEIEKAHALLPPISDEQMGIFNDHFSADMDEFLVWLSGWMSLLLKEDWNLEKKREVISKIIPIYKIRGTKRGLEEYLRIYVGEDVKITVTEYLEPFQIGVTCTIGVDTVVGDGRPYYFEVYMELPIPDRGLLEKKRKAIIDIIEQEKPAHTFYLLIIQVPTMQICRHSTVGIDSLLGGMIMEEK